MGEFNIDKYFSSRLRKHSEEIDTDAMWKALDLESEDDDRGLLFWLKGLLPLLLIGILFFYFSNRTTGEYLTQNTTTESVKTQHITSSQNKQKTQTELSTTTPNTSITSSPINETQKQQLSQKTTTNNNTSQSNNKPLELNTANSKTAPELPTSILTPITNRTTPYASSSYSQQSTSTAPFKRKETKSFGKASDNLAKKIVQGYPLQNELEGIAEIHSILFPLGHKRQEPELRLAVNLVEPLVERKTSRISLRLYSDYNIVNRQLSNSIGGEMEALVSARNDSESTLEMISAGAEIKLLTTGGLYFKTGLEYQSINEQFSFAYNRIDTIAIDNVPIANYVSATGDTTTQTRKGMGYQEVDADVISYNNHRLVNIPVSIGYQIEKGAWSIFAEGTCIASISHKFSGEQLDENLTIDSNPDYFSFSPKLGLAASVGVGYQLNRNINLIIQPRFQSFLNSFTTKGSGMNQTYSMYGLRVGASYMFN